MITLVASVLIAKNLLVLPSLFTDHMVMQRGKPIAVWGWDTPGTVVTVSFGKTEVKAVADSQGKFMTKLPKMREGGPFQLKVTGSSVREVNDVMVGEVWICSGQSNMEWVVANTLDRQQAQSEANPNIRMFTVQKKIAQSPEMDVKGSWVVAQSNTVDSFSAVGFAFAKRIYKDLNIPIGMIHTSWGGTLAEAWTSEEFIRKSPITEPIAKRASLIRASANNTVEKNQALLATWERKAYPAFFEEGNSDWSKVGFDESGWEDVSMPHKFPTSFDGSFYYRKTIALTAQQASNIKTLSLGAIDDIDRTFVNGQLVGSTTMTTPTYWASYRNYTVPSGCLREGENTIAVKAYDHGSGGGFYGEAGDFKLGDIDISANWKAKKGEDHIQPDLKKIGQQPQLGDGMNTPNFPSNLYNGMLAPLAPYSIKGAIWYQGESNAGRAYQYTTLLSSMIGNWRKDFGQGDFPFYIAQLANFMQPSTTQFDSAWAELRDSQDRVGQMKNCGTATIIDIGDAADIHPRNKRDVGERLARIALKKDYRKGIEWQGPRFKKLSINGSNAVVELSHSRGLKTTDGTSPRFFAICGDDKQWKWADAKIEGNKVLLSHPLVAKPIAVRYAWQDNPGVNLVNEDGLPAMPFRTDDFPLITLKNL